MSDTCTLDDVKEAARALSPWAHLATIGADGEPDVVPVHPCWEGDTLWMMVYVESVKAKNVSANPKVAMHWQVSEAGDGVELWGTATLHTDVDTKRRLWNGVFDYDLDAFSQGGPEAADNAFIGIQPSRAVIIKTYGVGGTRRWRA